MTECWTLAADTRATNSCFGQLYYVQINNNVSSYLPTVWLASCLIRLNCFFILCFSALTPGGRATPHISLIGWSQISALIYGRRRGSVFKHPVCGNIELNPPHFCWWGLRVSVIRSAPLLQRCWTDFSLSLSRSPPPPQVTDSSLATRRSPPVHCGKCSSLFRSPHHRASVHC